jgi:hypothetical protein
MVRVSEGSGKRQFHEDESFFCFFKCLGEHGIPASPAGDSIDTVLVSMRLGYERH